jgi:hypothetical protein
MTGYYGVLWLPTGAANLRRSPDAAMITRIPIIARDIEEAVDAANVILQVCVARSERLPVTTAVRTFPNNATEDKRDF